MSGKVQCTYIDTLTFPGSNTYGLNETCSSREKLWDVSLKCKYVI